MGLRSVIWVILAIENRNVRENKRIDAFEARDIEGIQTGIRSSSMVRINAAP